MNTQGESRYSGKRRFSGRRKFLVFFLCAVMVIPLLPTTAFAEVVRNNPAGTTLDRVENTDEMAQNSGEVVYNDGEIEVNDGRVAYNDDGRMGVNNGTVEHHRGDSLPKNNGTVEISSAKIIENYGTVEQNVNVMENNYGTVEKNMTMVEHNYGIVIENKGAVVNNYGGTVNGNRAVNEYHTMTLDGTNTGQLEITGITEGNGEKWVQGISGVITLIPKNGYEFVEEPTVTNGSVSVKLSAGSYQVSNATENTIITVNMIKTSSPPPPPAPDPIYSVKLITNGGTIDKGNVTSYTAGIGAMLPAAVDMTYADHVFVGWYQQPDFSGDRTTQIDATASGNKVYYARWASTLTTVSSVSVGGTVGTIQGTNIQVILPVGLTVPTAAQAISIATAEGATVSNLQTTDSGRTWTFTITAEDGTTTKNYTLDVSAQYTVAVSQREGGTAAGGGIFKEGTFVTVTAIPAIDYRFFGWGEDNVTVSTEASYSFVLDRNRTLVAYFYVDYSDYTGLSQKYKNKNQHAFRGHSLSQV